MEVPAVERESSPARPRAVEVAELYPPQGEWTEADYFTLPDTNRYLELSEGVLLMPPHPTRRHQIAVQELYVQLRAFVQGHNLGEVYIAPLPVRLWPGKIREPDVLFMAWEHRDRIGEQVFGPPDLVMEVTSPSTRHTDRLEKMSEYARAGIPEYWLVDPEARAVEVFVLRGGVYELLGQWRPGDTARSALLEGFEVLVSTLLVD
jgi:Uma2 family endonuclease